MIMKALKKPGIYIVSMLGAAGTALQNYSAVAAFLKSIFHAAFAGSKIGLGLIHGLAISLGGLCSGVVNLCINIELLENFLERVTQKKKPQLQGWQRFRYWFGSGVFVATGVLFGLTTLAFGPIGPLAALGIAAGIFVAGIMIIQELETWLEGFDNVGKEQKKSLKEIFKEWKATLTKSKAFGTIIAIGNVVALSLLFTMGLGSFLLSVGVPALPAIVTALVIAFTGGAFTEFYFYNRFLATFCNKIKENWHKFWQTKYPIVGLLCGVANSVVNGVLSYIGIMMITGLIAAAGIAVPPLGVLIAVAVTAALFAAAASFILGMDFWIRNSEKLTNFFKKSKETVVEPSANGSTRIINLVVEKKPQSGVEPELIHEDKLEAEVELHNDSISMQKHTLFPLPTNSTSEVKHNPMKSMQPIFKLTG
jgi:MFS family permease